jgi:hypothetical protein
LRVREPTPPIAVGTYDLLANGRAELAADVVEVDDGYFDVLARGGRLYDPRQGNREATQRERERGDHQRPPPRNHRYDGAKHQS